MLQKDSAPPKDSFNAVPAILSVSKRPLKDSTWILHPGPSFSLPIVRSQILEHHPYFGFSAKVSVSQPSQLKQFRGKEVLFYLLVLLLIIFGLMRQAFPKYFSDLFRLFFRTTLKQRQIKEQLMQTPLPSLLLNVFFVVSGGLYLGFVLEHFQLNPAGNFWLLCLYCCGGLSGLYLVKFAGLKIMGWLFVMQEAADAYIFIVFIVNKMIGMTLLPFLVLLAFTVGDIYTASLTLSWCLVAALLIYRVILTYAAVRNQVKVNLFHFVLYLAAFEIAPLLLVYRGLLLFFRITA